MTKLLTGEGGVPFHESKGAEATQLFLTQY